MRKEDNHKIARQVQLGKCSALLTIIWSGSSKIMIFRMTQTGLKMWAGCRAAQFLILEVDLEVHFPQVSLAQDETHLFRGNQHSATRSNLNSSNHFLYNLKTWSSSKVATQPVLLSMCQLPPSSLNSWVILKRSPALDASQRVKGHPIPFQSIAFLLSAFMPIYLELSRLISGLGCRLNATVNLL